MKVDGRRNRKVGVLALQGAFQEHVFILKTLGVEGVEVRLPIDLESIDSLIIPGGESTAIIKIADSTGLIEPLKKFIASGKPVWGTCAGMILLANSATATKQGGQELLGGFDAVVQRNYFGSQLHSFEASIDGPTGFQSSPFVAVFIRAPAILSYSDNVKILASVNYQFPKKDTFENVIVAAQQGSMLVTAFHPELTNDHRWHEYFLTLLK